MKLFGLQLGSGHCEKKDFEEKDDCSKEIITTPKSQAPTKYKKETWCRNCAYWILAPPAKTLRYWRTNLVVPAYCVVCLAKGSTMIHPWSFKFEDNQNIQHRELDGAERKRFDSWNNEKHKGMTVKLLEKVNGILEMSEQEYMDQCLLVKSRWEKLEDDRQAWNRCTLKCDLKYSKKETWCRNCSYWIHPKNLKEVKIWETGLIDSRDCPVCAIKFKLSLEITSDTLAKFEWSTFERWKKPEKGKPGPKPNHHYFELSQDFRNELKQLETQSLVGEMEEFSFDLRCRKIQDIWDELEADRCELDLESRGEIMT
ncbi:hypothetical protein MMC10_002342 [Thelotrema lepadinum]|nr:hypothetical protein [Thelotrema lepadinum]